MHRSIPIFGSRATVELDDANNLVAARAKLGRVEGVSQTPGLSPKAAFDKLLASVAPLDQQASTALAKRLSTASASVDVLLRSPQRSNGTSPTFSATCPQCLRVGGGRSGPAQRNGPRRWAADLDRGTGAPPARANAFLYWTTWSTPTTAASSTTTASPRRRRRLPGRQSAQRSACLRCSSAGAGSTRTVSTRPIFVREVKGGFELNDPVRKIQDVRFRRTERRRRRPPEGANPCRRRDRQLRRSVDTRRVRSSQRFARVSVLQRRADPARR